MNEVRQRETIGPSTTPTTDEKKVGRDAAGKKYETVATRRPTVPFYRSRCWKAAKGTAACTTITVMLVAAMIFYWMTAADD